MKPTSKKTDGEEPDTGNSMMHNLEEIAELADEIERMWHIETDFKGSLFFGRKHEDTKCSD